MRARFSVDRRKTKKTAPSRADQDVPPERRARVAAKAAVLREAMTLEELRNARSLSQEAVAEMLSQPAVAKMEKRRHPRERPAALIEALGGTLAITAHFADADVNLHSGASPRGARENPIRSR
jgi:hypothetical protein